MTKKIAQTMGDTERLDLRSQKLGRGGWETTEHEHWCQQNRLDVDDLY